MQKINTQNIENQRLKALAQLEILDSLPEPLYDDITKLAAAICKTRYSSINFLDEKRQWFKSKLGFDINEMPRELALCNVTIQAPTKLTIIPDISSDKRFKQFTNLKEVKNIRFYAGAPLLSPDGFAVGTLCVYDEDLLQLSDAKQENLMLLARQVSSLLALRQTSSLLAKANEQLAKTSKEFQHFFDVNPDLFCVFDLNGRLKRFNARWQSLLGYQPDELQDRLLSELVHPDDLGPTMAKLMAWNKPEVMKVENRCLTKAGEYKEVEWHIQLVENQVYASIIDISAQVNSQRQIEAQKTQFELAIAGSNDGIWDWNIETGDLFLSSHWKAMLGYEDHELANHFSTFMQLLHPDDHKRVFDYVDDYFSGNIESYEIEFRMLHKDRSVRWILARGAALRNSEGKPYRMAGSHTDISERKSAEEELVRTRFILEQAGRAAKLGAWEVDFEKNVQTWSTVTREILEVPPDFVVDMQSGFAFMKDGPQKDEMIRQRTRAIEEGIPYDLETEIITAKGNVKWVRTVGHPEFRDGKCVRLFGTFQDIHQRKLEQLEIQEKVKLQNVIVGSNFGTWQWNIQTGESVYDERWAAIVGYQLHEINNTNADTFAGLAHPQDKLKSDLALQEHISGKSDFYECEIRLKHKQGHWVWVLDKGKVLTWTPDGKPLMMFGAHQDISARKNSQKELELLKNLINNSSDAIQVAKEDGTVFYLNKKAKHIIGLDDDLPIGFAVYHYEKMLDSKAKWAEHVKEVKQAGEITFVGENTNIKTGKITPGEATVKFISIEGENYLIAIERDITERLASQKELTKINELFEQTSRISKTGAYELDIENQTLYWSEVTKKIHEVSPDFIPDLSKAVDFYKEGESRETLIQAVNNAIGLGQGFDLELQIVTASGNEKWVRALGSLEVQHGKPFKMYGTFQDIDERKKAELALLESNTRFKAVIESTKDNVFALDNNMNYLAFNQNHFNAMKAIYGLDIELGRNILEFMQFGNDREVAKADIERALSGEQFSIVQEYGDTALLRTYFEATYNPIKSIEGKVQGAAVFIRDISERKRAEQEIKDELSLREILYNISTNLINIDLDTVEDAFENSLKELGEFVKVDRAYIFHVNMEELTASMTHEWVKEGFESEKEVLQNIPISTDDEWVANHLTGKSFYVSDVDHYSNNQKLRQLWLDQGIKSMLTIPIIENGLLVGFVGFDSMQNHHIYTEREEKLLNLYAQMLVNIRSREKQEKQLINEIDFQSILLNVLAVYINIDLGEVETILNKSLRELGEFINADRAYIFEYNFGEDYTCNTHEWCAEGISPQIESLQRIPLDYMSEWIKMHRQNKPFMIENVDQIDGEKEPLVRQILQEQGIKSLITVPLISNQELVGFVGFDSVKQYYKYSDKEQKLLFVYSQMLINVKNRQKREQRLVLQEEKYRNIITNMNLGLLEVSNNDTILLANQGFCDMSGYALEEILGKTASSIFLPEDGSQIFEEVQSKRVQGISDKYQLKVKNKMGEDRWWFTSGAPNYNDQQVLTGSVGIHLDITDQKRLEDQQELLLKLTQNQNDRLKNFAHIVSHNLRSHTINIKSLNELILDLKPELKELDLVQLMSQATNNLLETIDHLSEVAILNTNELKQLEEIELAATVKKAIDNVSALAITASVNIKNELIGNEKVLGLPAYMDSIVLNVLTNAIKYRSKTKEAFVKLSCKVEKNYLVLVVEDNGLGIDLQRHGQKLFGMYKTFHTHPDSRGIGLFITKNQVEAMGGRIEVESEVNQGTSFKIFFQHG